MTDAHCHVSLNQSSIRELLIGRDFIGIHPWQTLETNFALPDWSAFEARLRELPECGVGEIGLDRLREREIPTVMRETFANQLAIAERFARPVVLHGAKCWGEVVKACLSLGGRIPAFLFHGFSRSDGLVPDIVRLNGFISVGPAVLNEHAVNYRRLVAKLPDSCLLLETDRTVENAATCPPIADIAAKVAELRGVSLLQIESLTDANALRFKER